MSDKKNVLLIVNPCAGRTKSRAATFDIVDKFSSNDYNFTVRTTTCQGDATNIVKRELEGHDLVVCCGGDGTLNETVNGVMDMPRRTPIGYIPTGTTNDLATTIGIPSGISEATNLIMSGQMNDYDIGLFNNRYYTYVASFGAFSRASYATSQKLKNKFGYAAYLAAAVPEVANIRKYRMRIEHDEGVLEGDFLFGAMSNSTSVGGFFKFKKEDVKLNDGYFEVLLVRTMPVNIPNILSVLNKVRHQQYDNKNIIFLRTSKLKITCDQEVDWTVDGEYAGAHRDVRINVLERAVDICSPENPLFLKRELKVDDGEDGEPKERKYFKRRKAKEVVEEVKEEIEELAEDIAEEIAEVLD